MTITEEQRDEAYEHANAEQKRKYGSSVSGQKLRTIANQHGITDESTYRAFAITVGDVILGLRQRTELPTLIAEAAGVPQETAVAITGDLIEFLDTPLPTESSDVEDLSAEIAATEQAMAGMETRTESETAEPTYTTSQETLLRESGNTR